MAWEGLAERSAHAQGGEGLVFFALPRLLAAPARLDERAAGRDGRRARGPEWAVSARALHGALAGRSSSSSTAWPRTRTTRRRTRTTRDGSPGAPALARPGRLLAWTRRTRRRTGTARLAGRPSSSSPWPAARVDEEDAAEDEDGTAHRALRLRLASSCCCSWASARRGRRGWPTPCVLAVAVACVPELSRACVLAVLEALACVPERRPPRAC
ncbi:uncharacterized protein [Triticum aestivum]|uniref:uncharacterized protein n=1 Tax=Triticum aestivum TaxID=4565 RepID=UPI001D034571|nr:uncharacterized protein LOC123148627 [Triticum aestivum]